MRIISATNKNLFDMVEEGDFREDLYYRLNVLPLFLPPLRERKEDILPIFYSLAHQMNSLMQLSPGALGALKNYSWRGNVRELRNVAEFLVSKGKKYIEEEDLPPLRDKQRNSINDVSITENSTLIDQFILNEGREIALYYACLLYTSRCV